MNERRKIAANGHISVAVALGRNGQINGKPAIRMQGVPVEEERDAFLDEASDAAQEAISDRFTDLEKLREKVRLAVRRSEEHTSELQSLIRISYAVFCLKKKRPKLRKKKQTIIHNTID